MFTSYAFVKLNEKDLDIVFEILGVIRYLFWLGKPAIVREKEIYITKEWLLDEEIDSLQFYQLTKGDRITMKKGLLKGQEAIVQKIGRKDVRLIIDTNRYYRNSSICKNEKK